MPLAPLDPRQCRAVDTQLTCQRVLTQTSRDTRLSDPLANVRPLHIGPHCVNIAQIGEVMKCLPAPISFLTRSAQIHLPSYPMEPRPYAVEQPCRDHGDTVGPAVGVPTGGDHRGVQELLTELAAQPVQVPELGDVVVDDAVEVAVELGPQRDRAALAGQQHNSLPAPLAFATNRAKITLQFYRRSATASRRSSSCESGQGEPGTKVTDRVTKPAEYAQAGIPGYWIVDLDPPVVTMTAQVLVDGVYEVTGEGDGVLRLITPIEAAIDLRRLTDLRRS